MAVETKALGLGGAFIIQPAVFPDERGVFCKLFTNEALSPMGVKPVFLEEYLVASKKGVLRGLHYQEGEFAQAKLITCVRGAIYDAIVDMRKDSPTFMQWEGVRLTEHNRLCLYVPRGFAHGYLSLEDGTVALYKADNGYAPKAEKGIRWDDGAIGIRWPEKAPLLSDKDKKWPYLK